MAKERCPKKEAYWRGVVRRHEESGLSASRFCEQSGIKLSSFYSWRKILARRERELCEPESTEAQVGTVGGNSFLPIGLIGSAGTLEIVHPHGCRIAIHGPVDSKSLGSILRVLDERGGQ